MPNGVRSALAVLAGLLTTAALTFVLSLLRSASHLSPASVAVALAPGALAALAGGALAARLAPLKPVHHALGLAMLLGLDGMLRLVQPAAAEPYNWQLLRAIVMPFAALAGGAVAASLSDGRSTKNLSDEAA